MGRGQREGGRDEKRTEGEDEVAYASPLTIAKSVLKTVVKKVELRGCSFLVDCCHQNPTQDTDWQCELSLLRKTQIGNVSGPH